MFELGTRPPVDEGLLITQFFKNFRVLKSPHPSAPLTPSPPGGRRGMSFVHSSVCLFTNLYYTLSGPERMKKSMSPYLPPRGEGGPLAVDEGLLITQLFKDFCVLKSPHPSLS